MIRNAVRPEILIKEIRVNIEKKKVKISTKIKNVKFKKNKKILEHDRHVTDHSNRRQRDLQPSSRDGVRDPSKAKPAQTNPRRRDRGSEPFAREEPPFARDLRLL